MNSHLLESKFKYGAVVIVGAVAGGLLMSNNPAQAQPKPATPTVSEAVTVVAPRVVRHKVGGSGPAGGPIEVLSLSRAVSYAALDLTKHKDVAKLEQRVRETAKGACEKIDAQYPQDVYVPIPGGHNCVDTAVEGAMPQVRQLVSAAGGQT